MFLVVGSWAAGVMGIADPINTTAPEAIGQLHSEGLRLMMLTGDSRTPAEVVAHKLDLARGGLPRIEGRGREQTKAGGLRPTRKRRADHRAWRATTGQGLVGSRPLSKWRLFPRTNVAKTIVNGGFFREGEGPMDPSRLESRSRLRYDSQSRKLSGGGIAKW